MTSIFLTGKGWRSFPVSAGSGEGTNLIACVEKGMHFRGDMRECKSIPSKFPAIGARVEVRDAGVFTFEEGTEFAGADGRGLP